MYQRQNKTIRPKIKLASQGEKTPIKVLVNGLAIFWNKSPPPTEAKR